MSAPTHYDFDEAFQDKVTALILRDPIFNQRVEGLVEPDYFESATCGTLVKLVNHYYSKHRRCPDRVVVDRMVTASIASKKVREDLREPLKEKLDALATVDISDRDFVIEEIATFAKHQAVERAILKSVELLEKRDFTTIEA